MKHVININILKIQDFLHWIARVVLFVMVWIGFIYITATYQSQKDDGSLYWFYGGMYATYLVLGLYLSADYIARKQKCSNKSLWRLWLLAIIFAFFTSYFWVSLFLLMWASQIFLPLLAVYTVIFVVILVSVKFK